MRKLGLSVALGGAVVLAPGAFVVPAVAGDQDSDATTIIVKEVVTGPATAGSTVVIDCGGSSVATLTFDKTGAPDTSSTGSFTKSNGAWQYQTTLPEEAITCTFTETVSGGAESTSWTCAYEYDRARHHQGSGRR